VTTPVKILLVGATGTIGSAITKAFSTRDHEVVRVGHSSGDHQVDLADKSSIEKLYAEVGEVDAVVCSAGVAEFGTLQALDDDAYASSLANKLMGQVNLVRVGLAYVAEGGSFTLTSGDLSQDPTPGTVAVAMTGGALESFGRAAALDLEGRRINVVSPAWVAETMEAMGMDPEPGTPASEVAETYVKVVEGDMTGQVVTTG
jgi:NAD(P)-dependent dehydrogenase (short-subunit alcohol dehydrogenase family)